MTELVLSTAARQAANALRSSCSMKGLGISSGRKQLMNGLCDGVMNVEDVDSVEEPGDCRRVPPQSSDPAKCPFEALDSSTE